VSCNCQHQTHCASQHALCIIFTHTFTLHHLLASKGWLTYSWTPHTFIEAKSFSNILVGSQPTAVHANTGMWPNFSCSHNNINSKNVYNFNYLILVVVSKQTITVCFYLSYVIQSEICYQPLVTPDHHWWILMTKLEDLHD
jgi:hypothetical protein